MSKTAKGQVASPASQCHLVSSGPSVWTPLSFHISPSACERAGAVKPQSIPGCCQVSVPVGCHLLAACHRKGHSGWRQSSRGLRSVPPAIWQCRVYRQSCQVSSLLRGETCAYTFLADQISFKLHNKTGRKLNEGSLHESAGTSRSWPRQAPWSNPHLLVNSLTTAMPILPPSCPPASKLQPELPDVGELGPQRDTFLCCPLPPPALSSQEQM